MHIRRGTDDSDLTVDDDFPACLTLRRAVCNSPLRDLAIGFEISALTPLSAVVGDLVWLNFD